MKGKKSSKVLAGILSLLMLSSAVPLSAYAAIDNYDKNFESETHTVFKHTEQTLAPGVTNYTNYAYSKDGKQMVYYVTTADLNRDDVVAQVAYRDMQNEVYGMEKLANMVSCANEKYSDPENSQYISDYYNVVSACNGDGYNMTTGEPSGVFIMGGNVKKDWNKSSNPTFLAILNDGSAVIDNTQEAWNACKEAGISEAIDVFGSTLVWDGKDITANASGSYNVDRHSRTMVGVTEDGKLVICSVDGRQEPFSCGASMHELAQIMLEAGCVRAFNLDGGGSTTFMAKNEGTDECVVINRPSDGSDRSISNGIIIASTAKPTNTFDHANLSVENNYVTPNSTVSVSAIGASSTNNAVAIPDDITWELEDNSFGTVENGVFTSNGTVGDAVVQMKWNGNVVGSVTIHVVIPEISFVNSTMTVPYNKTFKLNVTATTNGGLNEVALSDSDYFFELSDSNLGTIDGNSYTTCDESTGLTNGTITVKCVYDESKCDTTTLTFGKASVVAEDFEDFDISTWGAGTNYSIRPFGRLENAYVELVDSETGKVRSGNYSLALTADFTETTASGYKSIKYTFPTIDLTGATQFGMWMYLPVEDANNLEFDIGGYEYYIDNDTNVTEDGWYYISAKANSVGSSISKFVIYMVDPDETYYNIFDKFTIFIDDITIDYSNATDDREIPKFSSIKLVSGTDREVDLNGQTFDDNTVTVKATATEDLTGNYTGLNYDSARVFVDGVALDSAKYTCDKSGIITVADLVLSDGTHTFRFEIDDNSGNTGFATRKLVVNTKDSAVSVVRRSNAALPLTDSIEYFDVVAKNVENIESVTLSLGLDTLNSWELQGTDTLYGFDISYTVDKFSNEAEITLTRTGDVEATGEQVIASLPVRVWASKSYLMDKYIDSNRVTNSPALVDSGWALTPDAIWSSDGTHLVRIELDVDSIVVNYSDSSQDTFAGTEYNVITENNRYRASYYYDENGNAISADSTTVKQGKTKTHIHTETALEDKAATCTKSGYTGRTYCEVCDSVVDWGTTIPATDHTYEIIDDVLKCKDCGKLFNGEYEGKLYADGVLVNDWVDNSYYADGVKVTGIYNVDGYYYDFGDDGVCEDKAKYNGLLTEDGSLYYIALGVKTSGWFKVDENDYYFDATTLKAVDGVQKIDGHTYKFVDCVLMEGSLERTTSNNLTLYWAGRTYYNAWLNAQGKTYHFNAYGHLARGLCVLSVSTGGDKFAFVFNEDTGILERQITGNGLINDEKGTVYLVDDVAQYAGLVKEGSDYYYINSYCTAVTGRYWVAKTNGLLSGGYYDFAEDGKMINPPADKKDGISFESDGTYYYVDGVRTYAGLVKHGDDYYYFNSGLKAVTGTYWVAKTNDLLPGGNYKFDETGKMLQGLVEENGGTYYYVNGKLNNAGLIKVGDDYYYINSSCKAVTGTYWVNTTNGLMPAGYYNFDTNGVMLDAPVEKKDGISFESDGTYYYVDGVRTYAGLVKDGNDYYYFNSGLKAVTGTYWVAKTNDLLPGGNYKFDETGKMLQGLVEENGGTYYYVNGKLNNAGLIEVDGDYYYINSSCKAVTGKYWVNTTNGLMPAGYYNFDTNGKMILN